MMGPKVPQGGRRRAKLFAVQIRYRGTHCWIGGSLSERASARSSRTPAPVPESIGVQRHQPLPHRLRDRRGARDGPRHLVGWGNLASIALAIALAFLFGYSLTLGPVLRAGVPFRRALPVAFASDTASISVMEIVDNAFILLVPGAIAAGLSDALFWWSLGTSLVIAFVFALPVNRWLIARGKGHAVVHAYHAH